MESNTFEIASQETKFAATIKKAWQKACDVYLKESSLKVDSEEWTFINDTKDPSQIIQVITETWPKHKSSTATATDSTEYVASSSSAKKTGRFQATFNSVIGRKETTVVGFSSNLPQYKINSRMSTKVQARLRSCPENLLRRRP
jgi:hypothetical protein